MRTADKYILPDGRPPPPEPADIPVPDTPTRHRWTDAEKADFARLKPAAVYVVGTEHAVSGAVHDRHGRKVDSWGGIYGVRLFRIGVTSAAPWASKMTAAYARGPIPMQFIGRLWVPYGDDDSVRCGRASDDIKTGIARFEQLAELTLAGQAVHPEVNGCHALAHDTGDADLLAVIANAGIVNGMQWVVDDAGIHGECKRRCDQFARMQAMEAKQGGRRR